MSTMSMEALRKPLTARISSAICLFFFTFVFYVNPMSRAVAQEVQNDQQALSISGKAEERLNRGLLKMREIVEMKGDKILKRKELKKTQGFLGKAADAVGSFFGIVEDPENVDELIKLKTVLHEEHMKALADFESTGQFLISENFPNSIIKRHQKTVDEYKAAYKEMLANLDDVLNAKNLNDQQSAISLLDAVMKKHKLKKTHQKTNPNDLPWGSPNANKTRKPAETTDELALLTGISPIPQGIKVAANIITPDMLGNPGGPMAEDLAQTIDVQFTDAVKAKAIELDEDPVKIFNWVRNNIEFIPSYGSIQGADYTLQHGKGNAFDTASLLIALLRVSNIPARYAYGTVDVPADKVMNWVGDIQAPEAALNLLGQGGIPVRGLAIAGKIEKIRMEHVWVETWVDYFPSRASKHILGDSWIPLDASYKQYTYKDDSYRDLPFDQDMEEFANDLEEGVEIDETSGYVRGIDQNKVFNTLDKVTSTFENFISNQVSGTSLGDILGQKKVIIASYPQLSAGLPYEIITKTNNFSTLPENLRYKFQYSLNVNSNGQQGTEIVKFTKSLPELAGEHIGITFNLSTDDDKMVVKNFLSLPEDDATPVDVSSLTNRLPGHLINLTAKLEIGSDINHGSSPVKLGSELHETSSIWIPGSGWERKINFPTAGEYRTLKLNLQGSSAQEASGIQENIEKTKNSLQQATYDDIKAMGTRKLVGDFLYATMVSYMSINDSQDYLQSRQMGVVNYRLPSYGFFSTSIETTYWFGIPRYVSSDGMRMDVDRLAQQAVDANNNQENVIQFLKLSGARSSAMEHAIPENIFANETNGAEAISAVKALQIASLSGQKIWTINSSNLNLALSTINTNIDVVNDVRNAVLSGKIVTIHESEFNFRGSNIMGYIIIDPLTGSGAYLISSGENGSYLDVYPGGLVTSLLAGIGLLTAFAGPVGIAAVLTLSILLISAFHIFITYLKADLVLLDNACPEAMRELLKWLTAALFFLPKVFQEKMLALVLSIASVVIKGAVGGAAPACKGL